MGKALRRGLGLAAATLLSVGLWTSVPAAQVAPAGAPPAPVSAGSPCARFPASASSAYDHAAQAILLPWRTDLPRQVQPTTHPWEAIDFTDNWRGYMAAVLSEVGDADLKIENQKITMRADASWWISPWMDYGTSGREAKLGLTKERGPDAGDLSPTSTEGPQVWAVGFYNPEGAAGLSQIFVDSCNPTRPPMGWKFPPKTVSFKLLFTDASDVEVTYLQGAPTVTAMIDPPGVNRPAPIAGRVERQLKLIQLDIAVSDPDAPFGWVFGTFIWKNMGAPDLFGNLVPVGLMWGNDPTAAATPRDAFAELPSTRLNPQLAGVAWRGTVPWPERPWPGFQGRLNGPADNLRSSCMSCHALAQWPRSRELGIVPRPSAQYTLAALNDPARRDELRAKWMRDVPSGTLTEPSEATPTARWGGATPVDYSLQVEAGFSRMCQACADGKLSGSTPAVCRVRGASPAVTSATCGSNNIVDQLFGTRRRAPAMPRQ